MAVAECPGLLAMETVDVVRIIQHNRRRFFVKLVTPVDCDQLSSETLVVRK